LTAVETKQSPALSQLQDLQQQLRDVIRRRGRSSASRQTGTEARDEIAELLLKIQKIQEQHCL